MKLAVFSDVHGNLTALEAALADIEAHNPDVIWCLGDLAAFGPRPSACIQRIRDLREQFGKDKMHIIGGNTDRYLVTGERFKIPPAKDADAFARLAGEWSRRDSILNWNVGQITWDDYEFLGKILGREVAQRVDGFGTVIGYHAIPGNDETMLRPDIPDEEAADALLDREGHIAIGGHIHMHMDRSVGSWRVLNVGSVGMSFDKPGHAQWGLLTFDGGAVQVDLRAVPYDVDAAVADLAAAEHPAPDWVSRGLRPRG